MHKYMSKGLESFDKSLVFVRAIHESPVPCRGRYFLMPIRKYPKNRLRGGADREIYPTACVVAPLYPDFEPPSPEIPSRPLRGS